MATWAARSRARRWRGAGGVVLHVAGLRFVARRDAEGRFALVGAGGARVGTCDSLDECEARAWDVARERGLV